MGPPQPPPWGWGPAWPPHPASLSRRSALCASVLCSGMAIPQKCSRSDLSLLLGVTPQRVNQLVNKKILTQEARNTFDTLYGAFLVKEFRRAGVTGGYDDCRSSEGRISPPGQSIAVSLPYPPPCDQYGPLPRFFGPLCAFRWDPPCAFRHPPPSMRTPPILGPPSTGGYQEIEGSRGGRPNAA